MKHVLVATDGSQGADRAIDYAAQFAKSQGAGLLIVNVTAGLDLPEDIMRAFTQAQHTWFEGMISSLSARTLQKARERAHEAGVETIVLESRTGDIAQTIIDIAHEKNVDNIVVGKRGSGRVAGLLLGSVSQKLVSLAPVPVTVVP